MLGSSCRNGNCANLQGLLVLDGLNDGVVVILMNLLVEDLGHLLMMVRANMLIGDSRVDVVVYAGGVLSVRRHELVHGLLGFLHDDGGDLSWMLVDLVDVGCYCD